MPRPSYPVSRSRTRATLGVALAGALALVAAACSSDSDSGSSSGGASAAEAPPAKGDETLQVAYLPCGQINDRSWSQAGYEGIQQAEAALGLEVSVSESLSPAEVEDAMRDYARRGYDVIFGHCGSFVDAATKVAEEFPDVWFEAAGLPEGPTANTFAYDPRQEQGSFLAGMLAGFLTETDTVATIVAYDFPGFNRQSEAFALGARFVNPDITARSTYIETFEDAGLAKEAALSQIDDSADVLYVATDQAAVGAFEAATERGVLAIAQYADQFEVAPEAVVTSVLYQQGDTLISIIEQIAAGELEAGASISPGLDVGVGEFAPYYAFDSAVPQAAKDCIAQVRQEIIDGTFVVPGVDELGTSGAADDIEISDVEGASGHACLGVAAQ